MFATVVAIVACSRRDSDSCTSNVEALLSIVSCMCIHFATPSNCPKASAQSARVFRRCHVRPCCAACLKRQCPPAGGRSYSLTSIGLLAVARCCLPVTCFSLAAQCHYYSRKSVDSAHCTLTDTCSHRHRSPILTVPRGLRVIVWPSQRLTVTRTPAPCVPCEAMKASPASDFDVAHKQGIPTGAREHTHARARGGGGGHTHAHARTHTRAHGRTAARAHTLFCIALSGARVDASMASTPAA